MGLRCRWVEPKDFEDFVRWMKDSKEIQTADMRAVLRNRTTAVLVVEDEDGKVLLYTPLFAMLRIGYLGFNPDAGIRERVGAIKFQLPKILGFADRFGIDDVLSFRQDGCKVADWCADNGFEAEPREAIVYEGVPRKE